MDLLVKIIGITVVVTIFFSLLRQCLKRNLYIHSIWKYIVSSLGLIFLAMLLAISGDISLLPESNHTEALSFRIIFGSLTCFLSGYLLLAIGLRQLFQKITSMQSEQAELQQVNERHELLLLLANKRNYFPKSLDKRCRQPPGRIKTRRPRAYILGVEG